MSGRPHIDDRARRARLIDRHHLGRTATDPVAAVSGTVAMHSSDPVTPYLGCWARVAGFATADLDAALYETKKLWRMHAMRRTLFVVPAMDAAIFIAGACSRYAPRERRRVEGWLAEALPGIDVSAWLQQVERDTLAVLADSDRQLLSRELSELVSALETEITLGSGTWARRSPLSSRLLFMLALEGRIVRARPAGSWLSSQYHWAIAEQWFDRDPAPPEPADGRAALARRYLDRFGPATAEDLYWWAGWTKRQTAAALDALDAVPVDLDGGLGFVLPGDLSTPEPDEAQVALLPGLDPTSMGWKQRSWYLGDHRDSLLDGNGNIGPTVWVGGRIAGGWAQLPDGHVVWQLLEDVGTAAADRVAAEAAMLTEWLDGTVVSTRFPAPLERELAGEN